MPPHLTWDTAGKDFTVAIDVTPDSGIAVSGHLVITTTSKPDVVRELAYDDLVPSWSHTMDSDQTVHMTLMFVFHTDATSTVRIAGECRSPEGVKHQTDYSEPCSGKRDDIAHAYVWVN